MGAFPGRRARFGFRPIPIGDRRWGGRARRQAETVQNLPNGFGRLDRGEDPHGSTALGAFENVEGPHAGHQLRPGIVAGAASGFRARSVGPRGVGPTGSPLSGCRAAGTIWDRHLAAGASTPLYLRACHRFVACRSWNRESGSRQGRICDSGCTENVSPDQSQCI